MKPQKIYGNVLENKFIPINKKKFQSIFKKFNDKSVVVEVKEFDIRTLEQNSYYWVVINTIANYTGYDKDELHEYFKYKFILRAEVDYPDITIDKYLEPTGNISSIRDELASIMRFITTTKLTRKEFINYIEQIRDYSSREIGLYIKSPEEAKITEVRNEKIN